MQNVLYTPSLLLRPCTEADITLLHPHWTEPEVRRYLWDGRVISRETVQEVIEASLDAFHRWHYGLWLILSKTEGGFRGMCGLRESELAGPELLYSVPAGYWGLGIASESAGCVLRYAFTELGLAAVRARVDAPNLASRRVLEKLGFEIIDERVTPENQLVTYIITGKTLCSNKF